MRYNLPTIGDAFEPQNRWKHTLFTSVTMNDEKSLFTVEVQEKYWLLSHKIKPNSLIKTQTVCECFQLPIVLSKIGLAASLGLMISLAVL